MPRDARDARDARLQAFECYSGLNGSQVGWIAVEPTPPQKFQQ